MTSTLESQTIKIRAGDALPAFAAVLEDQNGNAVDLSDSMCYLQLVREDAVMIENECTIANAATGVVTYDWTVDETYTWGPGVYEMRVRVAWDDGAALIVPSDREARLVIRPQIAPLL